MTSLAPSPVRPATDSNPLTLAIVGDVHDQWSDADAVALHRLAVDLVLFVGDFGNEVVDVVRQVAALDLPKAVILGNHDAWYTATPWGRKKCPYNRQHEDWVAQQLQDLGDCHVGYGHVDLPQFGLSVVGGRPFSWGGSDWTNAPFYAERYGVQHFQDSIERICQAVDATRYDNLIFIGHCGPKGLGDAPEDPCGRDWKPLGGDFGDPDLAAAIAYAKDRGKAVPLVAFGHMHHTLRHRKDHLRRQTHSDGSTLYLNAARVPRWRQQHGQTQRHFALVTLQTNQVIRARQVWVDDQQGLVEAIEVQAMDSREPLALPLAISSQSTLR
ncbi:TIGR04168 family protein [Phormidium sp. FACHB-1136]|jgi:uncharacterized protein (TIGR04168 family)|uniref:TIGR04168 family protein n=1 Tax=Phormidium sp. FACHB-1136 TaxID=2692848 RepID=UPI001688FE64|nr:TIGR04168 family protein [Phormidium sp. FACHB-1136]MBD2426524.1 TIGR04168 family protein [Phormidium sp. FACHB-1136]